MGKHEARDLESAVRRMMLALMRRAGEGDEQAVECLGRLEKDASHLLKVSVRAWRKWQPGGHASSPSWADVGRLLGITRQSAQERFGRE